MEQSDNINDYKLPIKEPERNFEHVQKKQWYSLAELQAGDYAGMTESDSKTSGQEDGPYTPINRKSGPGSKHQGRELGFKVKLTKDTKIG